MDNLGFTIGTGIIGGLIASLIIFVFVEIWTKIVLPQITTLLYQDMMIDGEWFVEADFGTGDMRTRTLLIKQNAHSLTGTLVSTGGRDDGETYIIQGNFYNLIASLSYVANSPKLRDRGNITLIVKEDGHLLEGHSTYYSTDQDDIAVCHYKCRRRNARTTLTAQTESLPENA
ncbi:MAG: hypothetical protein NXH97_16190 [Rhodobacteraceae bacterium]|nr:hypothetical protein [Paracoccaceae bacterium]